MITARLLRDWGACWDDARIAAALGKRVAVSPREIATDKNISLHDRLWVLGRTIWYLDESAVRLIAIENASLVSHIAGDEDDQAIYSGLLNDLLQVDDLPAAERDTARLIVRESMYEAWNYACDIAWSAARAAVLHNARNTRDTVWSTADIVANVLAHNASMYAWSDALQDALDRALEWLGDYAEGWEES